ncbi:lytic transglycosylase domain-containing protein [Acidocella sp.]|uniref:lytic transglycosylase domain-containing protein n=1 Tax=Acidocella sp. TaxID=50710 RepID=UPI003D037A55
MIAAYAACAPYIAPPTLAAVIRVESGDDPLAIDVNGIGRFKPTSRADAEAIAQHFIARGHRVDIGLMQVDSTNLASLGVTVRDMLDPCKNIRAGATILSDDYQNALAAGQHGQRALAAALSAYNTGSLTAGFLNGYVARYHMTIRLPGTLTTAPMTVYRTGDTASHADQASTVKAGSTTAPSMTVYRKDNS